MSILHQEIHQQPDVIRNLLENETENARNIAAQIREFNPAFVMIAARGTSDNAARYAQYLMGIDAKLPVGLAAPSIHTLYDAQPDLSRALVIGISQSGRPPDVLQVVKDARAQGALTLGITNDPESPLAQEAAHHLWLRCGEEKSVAATKTYTAQLTAIALLTQHLVGDQERIEQLTRLPAFAAETLGLAQNIEEWVQRYRYMERIAFIGRGLNYSTAFEISLKIKELCYVVGEEYSEADFRHGPIAIVSSGFPVMVVAMAGKTLPLMVDLLQKLQERQAECIVLSNDVVARRYGVNSVALPPDVPEWLSPVCAVMPGQLFAYHLALAKGHEVEKPRGLTKVTITR
jgi:glucosamine--fructose-6-phosphate aminotransferase (isomerizing)